MNSTGFSDDAAASPRALAERLNAALGAHPSASEVLLRWRARQGLADRIVAVGLPGGGRRADPEVRAALQAAPGEPVRHRRVALTCGAHVLSRADNWYRPDELTPAMNRELDTTDRPFGIVARPLGYRRLRLEARVLVAADAAEAPDDVVLQRALLVKPSGAPISYVTEIYTAAVLRPRP